AGVALQPGTVAEDVGEAGRGRSPLSARVGRRIRSQASVSERRCATDAGRWAVGARRVLALRTVLGLLHGDLVNMRQRPGPARALDGLHCDILPLLLGVGQ